MKRVTLGALALLAFLCLIFTASCKRELTPAPGGAPAPVDTKMEHKTNPFSLRNLTKVVNSDKGARVASVNLASYPQFVYYRISPNFQQGQFAALGNDTSNFMMDYPFADGGVLSDSTLTEASIEQLRDGYMYGVVPVNNPILSQLQSTTNLGYQALDTLVLLPDSSSVITRMAYEEAGFDARLFGICLMKKPHGYVRYYDEVLQRNEPVRGMKVWAVFAGIPVSAYTDANGYYEINRRFSIGTIMGTKAENKRVTIRPLDTHGTLAGNILRIIAQFATGALNTYGWVKPCEMGDGKNFTYTDHTQARFWCQILNGYYFHDVYSAQEGISNAPDKMVCYAQWRGDNTSGSASTPMFGHISFTSAIIEAGLNDLFGTGINLGTNYPTLFNTLTGALPDMTIGTSYSTTGSYYNSRLSQTLFHELGHASIYRKVGNDWYARLVRAEISNGANNNYGDGTYTDAGIVAQAESWAEYIGTNFAIRRYPDGYMYGNIMPGPHKMSELIEKEAYYVQTFMPYGMYHDLVDALNTSESWDVISGMTIQQLFSAFGADVENICAYKTRLATNYPLPGIWTLLDHYTPKCITYSFYNDAMTRTLTRNTCPTPQAKGESGTVSVAADLFGSNISKTDANSKALAFLQSEVNRTKGCIYGVKKYTRSVKQTGGYFRCYFIYEYPDGTISFENSELIYGGCPVEPE